MAKKHKHEEHVNHERWLVSYADMVTLLFALFVVLYAIGVTELEKLQQLKKSIQWAFHISGEGQTKEEGIYDDRSGGGDLPEPAPLITAQDGAMREFLEEVLPREFEEVTGLSLTVVMTDDTVSFRAPLSAFFPPTRPFPVRTNIIGWLGKVVMGSLSFTSNIRIRVETPDVLVGEYNGRRLTAVQLCMQRLETLRRLVANMPEVRPHLIDVELAEQEPRPAAPAAEGTFSWEDRAQVIFAFSTRRGR